MVMAKLDDLHAKKYSSCTSDEKLLDILRARIASKIHGGAGDCFAYDVDVCSAPPYKLAEQHSSMAGAGSADGKVWCFFSPCATSGRPRSCGCGPSRAPTARSAGTRRASRSRRKGALTGSSPSSRAASRSRRVSPRSRGGSWSSTESRALTRLYARFTSLLGGLVVRLHRRQACRRRARARLQTDEEDDQRVQMDHDDDLGVLIAGDLAEEALQFGTEHMAEGQPEPQLAPEGLGNNNDQMPDENDDAMTFHVPDSVSFEEFYDWLEMEDGKPQGAVLPCGESEMVQTTHNPLVDYDVIMPLAAGQTSGELLDGPSTSGMYGSGLLSPPFDPAYIEEALSAPDPDPADIEELLSWRPLLRMTAA
ncbi:hypothetical protein ACP70R_046099 [Stipagrostis hirtigluma subsp. patula]